MNTVAQTAPRRKGTAYTQYREWLAQEATFEQQCKYEAARQRRMEAILEKTARETPENAGDMLWL